MKSVYTLLFFAALSLSRSFGIIYGVLISKIKFIVIKFIMSTENKDVCYNVYYNLSTERKLIVKIKTT